MAARKTKAKAKSAPAATKRTAKKAAPATKKVKAAPAAKKGRGGRPPVVTLTAPRGAPFRSSELDTVVRQLVKGKTLASVARAKNFSYPSLRAALVRTRRPTSPGDAIRIHMNETVLQEPEHSDGEELVGGPDVTQPGGEAAQEPA